MYCQMIRVISSPSSSTTGLVTLIFAMTDRAFLEIARFRDGWGVMCPRYSTAKALAKAKASCSFSRSFERQTARAVPAAPWRVTKIAQVKAPDRLEPVRRQGSDSGCLAAVARTGWRMAASGGFEVLVK